MTIELLIIAAFAALLVFLFVRGVALGYPKPPLDDSPLSRKEQAILAAAADAFFPHGGAMPLSASEAGAVRYFSDLARDVPAKTRLLIKLLLHFVEHGPWVFNLSRRFTRQTPQERVATLRSWQSHPIYFLRISFQSLRTLIAMAYMANDDVSARVHGTAPLASVREARAS